MKSRYSFVSLDSGNAQVKCLTAEGETVFPHSLNLLSEREQINLKERNDRMEDDNDSVYQVNGTWYKVGAKALRSGAGSALYGEARYKKDYYGVLAAIAMYKTFETSKNNVYLYGSHTPKDLIYRQDLVNAAKGKWTVKNGSTVKTFNVIAGAGADEPNLAYRHATLAADGRSYQGELILRRGDVLICDIGGFTLGISVASSGKIDYDSSQTYVTGILDVIDNVRDAIRANFRKELKGANTLDGMRLRAALQTGQYDAAALGMLNVSHEVQSACDLLMRDILQFYEQYGGASTFHSILICGGGGALMEHHIRRVIDHPHIYVADACRERMHFATVSGGMKVLRVLDESGRLE